MNDDVMRFRTDEDGHWFLIPNNLDARFTETLYELDDDDYETFNDEFLQYRADAPYSYAVRIVKYDP